MLIVLLLLMIVMVEKWYDGLASLSNLDKGPFLSMGLQPCLIISDCTPYENT
jgi:hypothetical protein